MKWFFLFYFLKGFLVSNAATYYSQGSLDPAQLSSWGNLMVGGTAPLSFTNAGDIFIIQNGHTMSTTATWIIGGTGSRLEIQNGGTLIGNNGIPFTGTFQIDNGGKYIHNNANFVASTAGTSIWSGTESFAPNSTVEIQNWINNLATLPGGISWGNLIINLAGNLGGSWNQAGNLTTIQGNLQIISSGTIAGQEFRITGTTNTILNIGNNLVIDGGILDIKFSNAAGTSCIVQVNGNVLVNNTGTLNVGTADVVLNSEIQFKGNFSAAVTAIVLSADNNAYLVANGTAPQILNCNTLLNCNFRVAAGAIVNQSGSLVTGSAKTFAVLGTYNDNSFSKTLNGPLEVAGGVFNATASLTMGLNRCRSCTGNGTYAGSGAVWCTATGTKGKINFNTSSITFNQSPASVLSVGLTGGLSPGDIYLANDAVVGFTAGSGGQGSVILNANSVLSIDANSYINGNADYSGLGGTLRIGSPDGIAATGNTTNGNIRVSGIKTYNSSGTNSFEYFGTSPQVTGDGLPATITGTLKINNTAGLGTSGVTLSQPATINNVLELISGKLTTSLAKLVILANSGTVNLPVPGVAYVNGPMKKIGSVSFSFPIGKGNNYAPLVLTGTGLATDEYIAEYFTGNPRATLGSAFENPPIDHMSVLEWWTVDRSTGTTAKNVTLTATTYSEATLLSDLHILQWDGSMWKDEGNTAFTGVSSGPVTSNVIANFFTAGTPTPFTLGSITSSENPLPVNLISFSASLSNNVTLINWELANPSSAAVKFDIERAGADKNFATIATLSGSAISNLYHYENNDLQKGLNYYRLKITDEQGTIKYSRIVTVFNNMDGLWLTSLLPTIIYNTATLMITSSKHQQLDLIITDMQGKIVVKRNYTISSGNTSVELSLNDLSAGVYQISGISNKVKTNSIRFIKK